MIFVMRLIVHSLHYCSGLNGGDSRSLPDREQFCLLASNFIRDMKSGSAPQGLSVGDG